MPSRGAPVETSVPPPLLLDARVPVIIPPPPATIARPTPPSGFSTARAYEEERDEEPAYEDMQLSSRYQAQDSSLPRGFLAALVLIALLAGVSLGRRRPRRRLEPSPVSVSSAPQSRRLRSR